MKKIALFFSAAALVGTGMLYGADVPKASWAEIVFDHPEKFTDIKDQQNPTEKGQRAILDNFRDYLTSKSKRFIPEGSKLTITFEDIQLAGSFEPWHGPNSDQVRIVKPIYPPRFIFTWNVTNAAGKVIKQGREDIIDNAFDLRLMPNWDDPLVFEKEILSDWMAASLADVKRLVASS